MGKGIGVYVGKTEVTAVSVSSSKGLPRLENVAVERIIAESTQETAAKKINKRATPESVAVEKALRKIKSPGGYVTAAFSPFYLVTRHFIMPAVPPKEQDEAVRYEASRYIPFTLSESVLDYSIQRTHKNVLSVTVCAVKQRVLRSHLMRLRFGTARVSMIEPTYIAMGRTFSVLGMWGKSKTVGFVFVDTDGNVNITLMSNGIVHLSRDFLLSGAKEDDKKRFEDELKASFHYFYELTGGEGVEQIFLAGHGDLPFWSEYFENVFNYSIRFDIASIPGDTNASPENLGAFIVPYGLALRNLGHKSPIGDIALLPLQERKSTPMQMGRAILINLAIVAALFFLIRLVVLQPYLGHLQTQEEKYLGPGVLRESAIVKKPVSDLRSIKGNLEGRLNQLSRFFKEKLFMKEILARLGASLPSSIWLDQISYSGASQGKGSKKKEWISSKRSKGKNRLNLQGICYLGHAERESQAVNQWIKKLSADKVFTESFRNITVEELKREQFLQRSTTRFRVVCE